MMPKTNSNGKHPIQLEPFKNFNPSNNHTQLQHQQQPVGNYQDCNPIDPVINNSSKHCCASYITNSPLQVAFKNLAPRNSSINCLQQLVKKPLLGLIFLRQNQSNHYQKDQNLQPLLDLLNPNGTNPSPTQRRTTQTPSIQNAFPVPSNNHQAIRTPLPNPHVHGKESKLVKDKQRSKEDLKKEILQLQEKIQTWGAFFSKDETHVITDHPLPTNSSLCSPSTNLQRRSNQSLTNQHIPLCKNLSPSPNKENGNSQAFKRRLRRLNGINQEDDCTRAEDEDMEEDQEERPVQKQPQPLDKVSGRDKISIWIDGGEDPMAPEKSTVGEAPDKDVAEPLDKNIAMEQEKWEQRRCGTKADYLLQRKADRERWLEGKTRGDNTSKKEETQDTCVLLVAGKEMKVIAPEVHKTLDYNDKTSYRTGECGKL
ncbi:hypothetical protein BY996DRAFT_8466694 [Phakopsora pachyrhizi]|nr:hypothetical protein BY996DRAFT_8466694 [Phakopsora pachyrhizi]